MDEEPKTADLRKQLKEDKKKFDKAIDCILALEKSVSGAEEESETENFGDDDDVVLDGLPANDEISELGELYAVSSQAPGEVL